MTASDDATSRGVVAMSQDGSFTGKVAFVTGAGSGIGRATALAFSRAGAGVVVADLAEEANQQTARLIEQSNGRAVAVRCDVTRSADVQAALQRAVDEFGRLDFAFNNAGIEQPIQATADLNEEEWARSLAVNLTGVFTCMKYEIPLMLEQGGGAIVNTSSGAGVKGFAGRLFGCQARRDRPDEGRSPRLRPVQHPRQRRLPGDHPDRDDGALHRRNRRRRGTSDCPGAHRAHG
jgi:NAD(P)-dependent dehydrogenase (short-subunit alcohol dehydrogenase family)